MLRMESSGLLSTLGLLADQMRLEISNTTKEDMLSGKLPETLKSRLYRLATDYLIPCLRAREDIDNLSPSQDTLKYIDTWLIMRYVHEKLGIVESCDVYLWSLVGVCLAIWQRESVNESTIKRITIFFETLSSITREEHQKLKNIQV